MAELMDRMQKDLIEAIKSSNDVKADVLRMAISRMKNERISKGDDLDQDEELKLVFSESKKIKDSIQQFEAASRGDLVEREQKQLEVLEEYLPEQASSDDIVKVVEAKISELGANGMQDFGKVMGVVMAELQGVADGTTVSEIVKEKLS